MRQAVIVSYARSGLAKAGRGGFNNTPSPEADDLQKEEMYHSDKHLKDDRPLVFG